MRKSSYMRLTVEKLRTYILVLGALLVVVIAGFFAYARWKVRNFAADLPGKLGIDIQQSAKEVTFSKSDEQGHTLFTLRASKAVQYKGNGRVLLHDVTLLLYNRKDGSADRVTGSDFDYDPEKGTARADGVVHLDLHAPAKPNGSTPNTIGPGQGPGEDEQTIHILTHGLLFDNKTGDASTTQQIEFRFPQAAGTAEGATYNATAGTLTLGSKVDVTSSNSGRDFRLRANHAEYVRETHVLNLVGASFDSEQQQGRADRAVVQLTEGGTVQHLTTDGHVEVEGDSGARLTADRGETWFDGKGDPLRTRFSGSLRFASQEPGRQVTGEAGRGLLLFANRQVESATLSDSVVLHEVQEQPAMRRELRSSQLDLAFVPESPAKKGEGGRAQQGAELRQAVATGGASLHVVKLAEGSAPQDTTLKADRLQSDFGADNQVAHVHGAGHTQMVSLGKEGQRQASSADDLQVDFANAKGAAGREQSGNEEAAGIESAVEQGHVVITQTGPPVDTTKGAPSGKGADAAPAETVARADRAEFRQESNTLTLTGSPSVTTAGLLMTAQAIRMERESGNATANGDVKTTYMQGAGGSGQAPTHVVADAGELFRADERAIFTGRARLWQQSSAIDAPVIELEKKAGHLLAHAEKGSGEGGRPAVHAVFVTEASGGRQPAPVRISSRQLAYSDVDRVGTFEGAVTVESADGRMQADEAVVTLMRDTAGGGLARGQAGTGPGASGKLTGPVTGASKSNDTGQQSRVGAPPGIAGSVERIVSTGHVSFEQPGRRGSGSRLVYTASDGRFVLTGTANALPEIVDGIHGTVTGESLVFLSRDDTVRVGREGR